MACIPLLARRYFGGAGTLFSGDVRLLPGASIFAEAGFEPGALVKYADYYHMKNPWLPRAAALKLPVGKTIVDADMIDTRTYEATEFYNDWVKPQGLYWMIAGQVLKQRTVGTGTSYTRAPGRGPFSLEEQLFFDQLMLHIARAAQIHRHLFALDLTKRASEHALDGIEMRAAHRRPASAHLVRQQRCRASAGARGRRSAA